jgi:hypothetical protein
LTVPDAVNDVLVGGALVAALTVSSPILRSRYNRWGASDDELAAAMPGDEQWLLQPRGDGTRLVVRQRLDYPDRFALLWHLLEPATFVMERRMLHGLKLRAERTNPR